MTQTSPYKEEALEVVRSQLKRLRDTLSFADALSLPEATAEDIVVAGKEVQLTIYRQSNVPFLKGQVLVTVQVARHKLGGMVSFHTEEGLVFSPNSAPRDATQKELLESGG